MRQVHPDTRFLLLGLPANHAASVGHRLRAAGATVDFACHRPYGHRYVRNKGYDVILVTLSARPTLDLADLMFYRQHAMGARLLAVVPFRDVGQIAHVLDGGADDCVTVPFDVEELLARLCALARRASACRPEGTVIRTHDLEINIASRIVRRDGHLIDLTLREYALLQLLALHCGRVVSRTLIREHLYGGVDSTMSNVIDVYIRYLRSKVDQGFRIPLILTRWGEGYLLREDADHEEQD